MTLENGEGTNFQASPGAAPGFPVGGGANPPGGCQHMILPNFAKKLHEIEKILGHGGHVLGAPPLRSATGHNAFQWTLLLPLDAWCVYTLN